jgi:predicted  nucleic acid-binding Zn-ribbon protein
MPNQCVHCSEIYDDGASEILSGCSKCGSRFFFYLTQEKLEKLKANEEESVELTKTEKKQVEKDVRDIVGVKDDEEAPIILDFESVRIIKPGKYILDIPNLFSKKRPLVYKLEDGKYIVDLTSKMGSGKEKY